MDKNSFQEAKQVWKGHIAVVLLVAMVAGLLWARGLASVAMFLFGVNALWDIHPKKWFSQKWWLLGLTWVAMYALSWFWSDNKGEWALHLQVKLPFMLLPLAFGFVPAFSEKQIRIIIWSVLLMILAGACFSMSPLLHSSADLIDSYNYAHVLPTPAYNDHISFSALVAVVIAWCFYYAPSLPERWQRILMYAIAAFLTVYLHVLAAKTGLVGLYILFAGLIGRQFFKSPKRGLSVLLLAIVTIGAAYTFIPTFRARIGYSIVTVRTYRGGDRSGIYSDAARVFSYDLAYKSIKQHPLLGVGSGDVFDEMEKGYARYYRQIQPEQMLWPHNQFLTTAMAAGIPAALMLIVWIVWPLRCVKRNRAGFFFVMVWLILLVPLMVDLILEVQAGVGVYLVLLLWQRKTLIHG